MSIDERPREITVDDDPRLNSVVIRGEQVVGGKRLVMSYAVSQQAQKSLPSAIEDGIVKVNAALDKAIYELPNDEAYIRGYRNGFIQNYSPGDAHWLAHPSFQLGKDDGQADQENGLTADKSRTLALAERDYPDVPWIKAVRSPTHRHTIPVGSVVQSGVYNQPAGFLPCDGRTVSSSAYPDLHAVMGDTYGGDTAAGTFQLPDFRGRIHSVTP